MNGTHQSRLGLWHDDADERWELGNFTVGRIPKNVAHRFVSEYHYSRGMGNAPISYGCRHYATGELVGVIAFHTPISENVRASVFEDIDGEASEWGERCEKCEHIESEHCYREHVTELHRMAIHPDAPKNTATWFISRALDHLKRDKPKYWAVLSHADMTEGHDGTVYQAASADYTGTTGKNVFYRDNNGRLRSPRQNGNRVTTADAKERGWTAEQREAKHRYVFWLPDPYQSKDELRELSNLETQAYP